VSASCWIRVRAAADWPRPGALCAPCSGAWGGSVVPGPLMAWAGGCTCSWWIERERDCARTSRVCTCMRLCSIVERAPAARDGMSACPWLIYMDCCCGNKVCGFQVGSPALSAACCSSLSLPTPFARAPFTPTHTLTLSAHSLPAQSPSWAQPFCALELVAGHLWCAWWLVRPVGSVSPHVGAHKAWQGLLLAC